MIEQKGKEKAEIKAHRTTQSEILHEDLSRQERRKETTKEIIDTQSNEQQS